MRDVSENVKLKETQEFDEAMEVVSQLVKEIVVILRINLATFLELFELLYRCASMIDIV